MAKRSLAIDGLTTPASSLSENVNLFQSLRVLQEGEAEPEVFQNSTVALQNGKYNWLIQFYFTHFVHSENIYEKKNI